MLEICMHTNVIHVLSFTLYPNTLLVFENLCNQANIRMNPVLVSALIINYGC